MGGTINSIFLGIIGINMVLIGAAAVIETVVMSMKEKRSVTHIKSIIYLFGGTSLVYFGSSFVSKFFGN